MYILRIFALCDVLILVFCIHAEVCWLQASVRYRSKCRKSAHVKNETCRMAITKFEGTEIVRLVKFNLALWTLFFAFAPTLVKADTTVCIEGKARVCNEMGICFILETPPAGICFDLGGGGGGAEPPIGGGNGGGTGGGGGGGDGGTNKGGKKKKK